MIPKEWIKHNKNVKLIGVNKRNRGDKIKSILRGHIHRFHNAVCSLIKTEKYDICVFDRNDTAGSLIKMIPNTTKIVVIHHNYEPDYFRDNAGIIFNTIFYNAIRKGERDAFLSSDLNIFLTKDDLQQFKDAYGANKGKNICMGVFPVKDEKIISIDSYNSYNTIIITGSLNNPQNIDAVRYFVDDLYPLIPIEYNIIIAGQSPDDKIVKALTPLPNVIVAPNPDDIADIVRKGTIYLCPARLGSGIKVRVLDGLRNGLPVLAHKVSAKGYHEFIEDEVLFSFDTKKSFARQFNLITKNIKREIITPNKVIESYRKNISTDSLLTKLKSNLNEI